MTVIETLKFLENHLAQYSYIEGYQPTSADVFMHNFLKTQSTSTYPNVHRWFKHIESFNNEEMKTFITTMLNPALTKVINGDGDAPTSATAADDDDVDLFASDEENDAEAERIKEERLKAYAEKKSKKAPITAKSSIVLDVKPWDDETDMKEMEQLVRTIQMDGLIWGASKLVPLAYGIQKLQIGCVVEDEKVSVDELTEKIQDFEDFVQSVDIAAFNKI